MNSEKIKHHIEALRAKHTKLDEQIDHMETSGSFDDNELHDLKKHRLALKDEIAQNEHKLTEI